VKDNEGALELLGPYFEAIPSVTQVKHAEVDPDLDPLRSAARFKKMVGDAKERLGTVQTAVAPAPA
jgi:adenylate cyclase